MVKLRSRLGTLATVGVVLVALGCEGALSAPSDSTPTPIPTPPNTVDAICDSARPALNRLERMLAVVDADALTDPGAAVAQITGILTTDAERLRGLPDGRTAGLDPWFTAIDHAAAAGVTAVRAAAAGDPDGFAAALRDFEQRWEASRAASAASGYPSCPY